MSAGVEKSFGTRPARPFHAIASRRGIERPVPLRIAIFGAQPHEHLAGLDLLRFAAAAAVVLFHFGYAGPMRGAIPQTMPLVEEAAKYGFIGVELFFMISGFVITASATGRNWASFAVSRFVRLYPGHLVCMTATAVVLVALGASRPVSLTQWLANLTMVAPALGKPFMDGAYWSIVIEIVFYGWVAVLLAAGLFQRRLLEIVAVWLLISFANELFFHARALRFALCTEYASFFASGILIQRLVAGERRLAAWALLGFAFGLGAIHALENQRIIARLYDDETSLPVFLFLHVALYAVFVLAIKGSRFIPASRALIALGSLTYPLYLVHQEAGYAIIARLAPLMDARLATLIATVLIVAFAAWVAHIVEPAARAFLLPRLLPLAAALRRHRLA